MKRWTDIHDDVDGWTEVEIVEAEKVPRMKRKPKTRRPRNAPGRRCLTDAQCAEIRDAYVSSEDRLCDIASRYGVSAMTISNVGRAA
jgi:hypothetical protein